MKTFTYELPVPVPTFDASSDKVQSVTTKRIFTFKELNEYDQDQQKLHFKISAIFEVAIGERDDAVGSEKTKLTLDTDTVHELTIKFINTCLITENEIGVKDSARELDKKELLMSSKAVYKLGSWLLHEKFYPFFLQFRTD